MNQNDFQIIIIRSVYEIAKLSFFEYERINNSCLQQDYIKCLKRAYIDLISEVNREYVMTAENEFLYDPDNHKCDDYGEIHYHFRKNIDLNQKTDGLLTGEMTSETLKKQLPYLTEYFTWLKNKFPQEFKFSNPNRTEQLFDRLFHDDLVETTNLIKMPGELQDQWERLKNSSMSELSYNLSNFDNIFNETEYLMSQCKKYKDDPFRVRELFLKYRNLDNSDRYTLIDGIRVRSPQRLMLIWIHKLTSLDLATYQFAYNYVDEILSEDDFLIYEIKDYKQFKKSDQPHSIENLNQIPPHSSSSKEKVDYNEILTEIADSENKFWKGLPMSFVVEHFKKMTIRKNKNGEPYLSPDQLISFLKKGFLLDETQPLQKINYCSKEKGFVIKLFYKLYDHSCSQCGHPADKAPFIKLITDCFDNWDNKTIPSLFKPNKVKREW